YAEKDDQRNADTDVDQASNLQALAFLEPVAAALGVQHFKRHLGAFARGLAQAAESLRFIEGLTFFALVLNPRHQRDKNCKQRHRANGKKHPQTEAFVAAK